MRTEKFLEVTLARSVLASFLFHSAAMDVMQRILHRHNTLPRHLKPASDETTYHSSIYLPLLYLMLLSSQISTQRLDPLMEDIPLSYLQGLIQARR